MPFNETMLNGKKQIFGFATYPEVVVRSSPKKGKAIQHLIFGDYIDCLPAEGQSKVRRQMGWIRIRSRGETGWIDEDLIQSERILEVNFVDIGQGDGCHIVTPEDKHIIIDAGQEDNMYRFLSWRFNLRKKTNVMKELTAIITHPDQDHYKGFNQLFGDRQLQFSTIFHNGLLERNSFTDTSLGTLTTINQEKFLNEIVETDTDMKNLINDPQISGSKRYPNTLLKAIKPNANPGVEFKMVHSGLGYLPGYEKSKDVSMEILGPVPELDATGKKCLKYFDSGKKIDKTKNGHSVSLMLRTGKLRILLGGDLNVQAENHLLKHYTKKDPIEIHKKLESETDPHKLKKLNAELDQLVKDGKRIYGSDIAKACHHGSHHFTKEFLQCVNPIATIISSGDNESHAHPRPDALGTFGKYGRGQRPLIFSTELARSTREQFIEPVKFREAIRKIASEISKENNSKKRERLNKRFDKMLHKIERSVAVYGTIIVRTDGRQVIICQKLEKPRSAGQKWDIHELIYNKDKKEFEYRIKLKH